jgi:hypothetical protein
MLTFREAFVSSCLDISLSRYLYRFDRYGRRSSSTAIARSVNLQISPKVKGDN